MNETLSFYDTYWYRYVLYRLSAAAGGWLSGAACCWEVGGGQGMIRFCLQNRAQEGRQRARRERGGPTKQKQEGCMQAGPHKTNATQ